MSKTVVGFVVRSGVNVYGIGRLLGLLVIIFGNVLVQGLCIFGLAVTIGFCKVFMIVMFFLLWSNRIG